MPSKPSRRQEPRRWLRRPPRHLWQDTAWMGERWRHNEREAPISIYKCISARGGAITRKAALPELSRTGRPAGALCGRPRLHAYRVMPVTEYPFDGSWATSRFRCSLPTSRFGSPDDFRGFVDACHRAGIGLLLDWVPGHFPPTRMVSGVSMAPRCTSMPTRARVCTATGTR